MRRHLLRFPGIERRCAHFSRLGEEDSQLCQSILLCVWT